MHAVCTAAPLDWLPCWGWCSLLKCICGWHRRLVPCWGWCSLLERACGWRRRTKGLVRYPFRLAAAGTAAALLGSAWGGSPGASLPPWLLLAGVGDAQVRAGTIRTVGSDQSRHAACHVCAGSASMSNVIRRGTVDTSLLLDLRLYSEACIQ